MRISDWSSDVCSSDLHVERLHLVGRDRRQQQLRVDRQQQLVFVEQQFFVEFLLVELGRQHQQLVGRSDPCSRAADDAIVRCSSSRACRAPPRGESQRRRRRRGLKKSTGGQGG